MKNFMMVLVALALMFTVSDANAQCVVRRGVGFNSFGRNAVVVNNGFNGFGRNAVVVNNGFSGISGFTQCIGGSCFTQSAVVVPQSTAFFTGGRSVAFVNQPFVNFGFPTQQVNVRRGVLGNVRRVQVNNVGVAGVQVINPAQNVVVGRRKVFVNGF